MVFKYGIISLLSFLSSKKKEGVKNENKIFFKKVITIEV